MCLLTCCNVVLVWLGPVVSCKPHFLDSLTRFTGQKTVICDLLDLPVQGVVRIARWRGYENDLVCLLITKLDMAERCLVGLPDVFHLGVGDGNGALSHGCGVLLKGLGWRKKWEMGTGSVSRRLSWD